ncbi:DUF3347 domain-containing protein [Chryseobacterium sp.]|uniref:DUF3347 domain-containing protein n=1 Tax=Chryseobacterium sp. TaxID=1871047 RepID=UPI0038902D16
MKKYFLAFVLFASITANAQSKVNANFGKLYQNYISIKSSLVADDAKKTSMEATQFLKTITAIKSTSISDKSKKSLELSAKSISAAKNIAEQRKSFYKLSDLMIEVANENSVSDKTIFVQFCPMAKGSWLSNEKQIANPYYGKSMLTCGSVKSEIK